MKFTHLLLLFAFVACTSSKTSQQKTTEASTSSNQPNILLVTLDDMNWNTPASYGGSIADLTPNIDKFAQNGIKFENAYVQAPNCSPSRVVIQTGLYPHQSGTRGFYYVQDHVKTLPEMLRANGYFTGVINKKADSSLSPDFENYWDDVSGPGQKGKYDAKKYNELTRNFIAKAKKNKKAFYGVVNIADPHKPFFNDDIAVKKGFDEQEPSKIYTLDDIELPGFLPDTDNQVIRQQYLNYINSSRRADDVVGGVLQSLEESGVAENTLVIFLSDHGMPFPYAKSSVYQNGVKTPMIVSWPDKIEKGSINETDLVSAVDIAPTLLDIVGAEIPNTLPGKSFRESLFNSNTNPREYVFAQFDENAGGVPRPLRTIISEKYGYIFNPWATGKYEFISDATHHPTYKQMRKLSNADENIKKRFDFWVYRAVEELYDYENDPNAMNNLIDDPEYKDVVEKLRKELQSQMEKTNDYVLDAFVNRADKPYLNTWMQDQLDEATVRRKTIKWKRYKNKSGPTKKNKALYSPN